MPVSGVSDHRAQAGRGYDLVTSRVRRPQVRPGMVRRSSLLERLARGDAGPIVSVVAPPGYGKTTLLSQWAERDGQAFAWVSVEEGDNDPKVLLRYIAEALDVVEPIDQRVFDALTSPASSIPGSVVPRLGSAFSSMTSPVVLVLDDVHVLHNSECRAALSVLADHVPGGSRLALAGRAGPPLRVARLRAEGKMIEIGPGDLSLTPSEALSLLRSAGVALSEDEMAELHERTEGWPAGLYLAGLYLREGGPLKWVAPLIRRGFVSEACEVDGAGGVEGFLRGADGESGAQDGVFVAVAGGGVDREAEGVGGAAVAQPEQRDLLAVAEHAGDVGEAAVVPGPDSGQLRPVVLGVIQQPQGDRAAGRFRDGGHVPHHAARWYPGRLGSGARERITPL